MATVFDIIEVDDEKDVLRVKQATEKGYAECDPGGVFDGAYPSSKLRRGRVQGGGKSPRLLLAKTVCMCL